MMILHVFSRGAEPFVRYRRYILHRNTSNSLILNQRHYKFLDTNGYCNPDRANRASSTCYYDHWLQRKLLEPYNCTFFYLQRGVQGYNVCDPDLVVRKQKLILDTDMGGTKVCTIPDIGYCLGRSYAKYLPTARRIGFCSFLVFSTL